MTSRSLAPRLAAPSAPPARGARLCLVPSQAPFQPIRRPPAARHAPSVYLASLSPGSRRAQRAALDKIARLLSDEACDFWTLPWAQVRYEHSAALRAYLSDKSAPATAKRELAALRGALKSAWRLGELDSETLARTLDIAPVRGQSLPPGRQLSAGEIRAIFDACAGDTSLVGARDAAMLAVAFGAGLRRFEIVALDFDCYNPEDGALSVQKGKGNQGRVCYLGASGRDALDYWIEFRGRRPGALLLPITRGGRMMRRHLNPQSVMVVCRKRGAEAGLRRFTPHDLRRTFISNLLDNGEDIVTAQKLAGHASPSTTAKYDRRGEVVKKRAAEGLFVPFSRPRNR